MTSSAEELARKFELTMQLHEEGVRLMRQNLRRRFPDESDDEIEERLGAWLSERPGAEFGDADGRPGHWPRR